MWKCEYSPIYRFPRFSVSYVIIHVMRLNRGKLYHFYYLNL